MFCETMYNYHQFYETGCLPLLLMSCGQNESQEPILRRGGFACHHALWVTAGKCTATVGGQTLLLSAGEGFFCRGGVPHGYRAQGDTCSTRWVTFFGLDGLLEHYGVGPFFRFAISDEAAREAESLEQFCLQGRSCVERSVEGYRFVAGFLQEIFGEQQSFAAWVDRVLESRFDRDLSLEEIAARCGVGKYTLCHRYVVERGVTVGRQLTRIRVAKAKQLLLTTALPVAEVGRLCGFAAPAYFGKIFREQTGCTPSGYRASKSGE